MAEHSRGNLMRNLTLLALAMSLGSHASAQLILPYSGTDSTATLSAFQIIKSGTAGRASTLYISNASNTSDVLLANTIGLGKCGFFQVNNPNNATQALRGESNGRGIGVFGLMTGTGRGGVFRIVNPASTNYALFAETDGSGPALKVNAGTGLAGDFVGAIRATSPVTAIYGESTGGETVGIHGKGYTGVYAEGGRFGVRAAGGYYGVQATGTIFGVVAYGPTAVAGYGSDYGTYGVGGPIGAFGSGSSYGVFGSGPVGVYGQGTGNSTFGVRGQGNYGGTYGYGSRIGARGDSPYVGVWGEGGTYGSYGLATATTGANYGVYAHTYSSAGYAIYANGRSATTGTKSFVIDHPLDPENKVLNHFCTEAPEPLNAYSGNIVTDERGYATVQLPEYFGSINKDFRYQLTVLDGGDDFVQVKVSKRIQGNQFTIRTSQAAVEVSWRVEGVRNDRWVQQRGFKTEEAKPTAHRGKYIEPALYGLPEDRGIHAKLKNQPAPTLQRNTPFPAVPMPPLNEAQRRRSLGR